MSDTQYTLWKPEDGRQVCLDGSAYTFEELQRQVDACQIDSTWGYSLLGSRQCRPLKQLRDEGRQLDLRPAVALVVSLEDLDDPKTHQDLQKKRERLNRRGVKHRVVSRAPTNFYDDGDNFASTVLKTDAGETWLHDCTCVYLVGDRVVQLLDHDAIARDTGLEKALLAPLRAHCLGDVKTAKPLRYLDWKGNRTHRDLPDEILSVANRKEVPAKIRSVLNRAERALVDRARSPIPLIATGIFTLLVIAGWGVSGWRRQPPAKVFTATAHFLSERDGIYELIVWSNDPNVAELRLEYPYSCEDPASIESAWEQALREARSRKVKEADLPTTRLPSRCAAADPPEEPKAEFTARCRYYELKLFEPNQAVASQTHYQSFDAASRQDAWDKLTELARDFGVPDSILRKNALDPVCPPTFDQQQITRVSQATRAVAAIQRPSLPPAERIRIEDSVYQSLQELPLEKGSVPNQLLLMSLELNHAFMALHHQVDASKCEVFVLHRSDNPAMTLNLERDISEIQAPSNGNLTALRNRASLLFRKHYWKSLIDRSSSLPNVKNIKDIYLIGTIPRTTARLLGAENRTIDFLAPSSGLAAYTINPAALDAELSPEEAAAAVGIMQALLRDVESSQVFASTKKRLFYSPSVEKTFAEKVDP